MAGDRPGSRSADASGKALTGLRVLDLTQHIAGPYATKLLADNGADVLKIEPPAGDLTRGMSPFAADQPGSDRSGLYLALNAGKRSIVVDLRTEGGRARLAGLARDADLVVESFRPGVLAALGFPYERLAELNPAIVLASVSNFGQTGPFRDYVASDLTLYAIGAEMYSMGIAGREPVKQHGTSMLYQSGAMAAGAALAAGLAAKRDGVGQWVDVAITETHTAGVDRRSEALIGYQFTGRSTPRTEGVALGLPGGVYPCADGYLEIDWLIRDWSQIVAMLDAPDGLDDPRYWTGEARQDPGLVQRSHEAILTWLAGKTMVEAWEVGQKLGVPCGPLFTIEDLLANEHLRARGYWGEVAQPDLGRITVPGPPFRLGASPWLGARAAPGLGGHDGEGWIGSSDGDPIRDRAGTMNRAPTREPEIVSAARRDSSAGSGDSRGGSTRARPLEGVRVIDLCVVWAGQFGTQLLADLGAEVIKLENPHLWAGYTRGVSARPTAETVKPMVPWFGGYPNDEPGAHAWNRCAGVVNLFRNKHSATLDLRTDKGMELFWRLVAESDVVYENNATPTMPKLGITYEALRAVNPRIIFLRAPAFGSTGPYADYRALGPNVEGFIGHTLMRGYADTDASSNSSVYASDYISGAHGAFAVMAALRQREATGEGQLIEMSMVESAVPMFTEAVMDYVLNQRLHAPIGNRDIHGAAPQGCYPALGADEWIALTICTDEQWRALCRLMIRDDLAADAGLAAAAGRMSRHNETDAAIAAWTRSLGKWEIFERLQSTGIPAAPVLSSAEAWDDPQLRARGFFERITHPEIGDYPWPGMAYRLNGTPISIRNPPVALGEDNEYVYREVLGLSDGEWAELLASGMIATEFDVGIP